MEVKVCRHIKSILKKTPKNRNEKVVRETKFEQAATYLVAAAAATALVADLPAGGVGSEDSSVVS